MQTQIINGRKIRDEILEKVKDGVRELPFQPVFCDVLVGNDPVLKQYIKMKAKTSESVGIHFYHAEFPEDITTDELVNEIKKLNNLENMCGLIVQLPLPPHIDKSQVLDAIDKNIDVDCLGKIASDIFYNNDINIGYPTALACIEIIDSIGFDLKNKKIVIMGQGELVGKPVTHLLHMRDLQVATITRKTENKYELLKNADLIISAIGDGKYLTGDMIKEGVLIIDAGTSESTSGIVGDVDTESVIGVASAVSPVPGGVGPVTVAMLLKNILKVAKNRI